MPKHTRNEPSVKLALSMAEAAAALSVSRPTLYNVVNAGHLRTRKLGGRRLVTVAELERYLSTLPES